MVRLQKAIADSGFCSRRKAEEYIINGKVSVNGDVITELGTKVNPGDEIIVDGVNGILVDVGDKTQLVKAMEFMAVSSNDSSRIGFEAIKFRNKCSSDAVADEWLNVIEKVYK